jgi:hypothetical protein
VRLLNCVFSYNRYYYLKNAVESLIEYFRFGDTLIVDDGSTDPSLLDYLSYLETKNVGIIRQPGRSDESFYMNSHGGLYENMDTAVQFASIHGYDYIQFIQDDVQFIWHDPQLLTKVETIFRTFTDAAQVGNIFFKGIVRAETLRRLELIPQANCYHLQPYGMSDMGIVPVALLKEHGFRFGNGSEKPNSAWWRRRGYRAYSLSAPTMSWVPWPGVIQFGNESAEGHPPVQKYYLEPLDGHQIERLLTKPLKDVPFAEDYCLPWDWNCPKPYWFTYNPEEYRQLLADSSQPTRPLWKTVGSTLLPKVLRMRLHTALRTLLTNLES